MVSMLQKKIFRDIKESGWSFIAIVCICSLGIALFSGINLYINTMENAVDDYYHTASLSDYWIYKTDVSQEDLDHVLTLSDVEKAQRRKTIETGLSGGINATLRLHAIDGKAEINIPDLLEGELLDGAESNAILLDSRFAEANGLRAGDSIQFGIGNQQRDWLIKGIIRSAEYVYYAPDGMTIPNYQKYGFAYTNSNALPEIPFNEIVLSLQENSENSDEKMTAALRNSLGNVNIINRLHQSSSRYVADDLNGLKPIGMLFPLAFFLTAALITWITVGRMMENQRQHLGTLRSLGYSKREIMGRYGFYGIMLTVPSMIAGWFITRYLAGFLYKTGTTYYTIPNKGVEYFSYHFFLAAFCVALVTYGASWLSCRKSLKSTPASLMRPKPPTQGHRILLERITPFWRNLSFSGKIVARNLFRNKGRMLMGLIGIIGSTSLILCGFGLMSSTDTMIDQAFNKTMQYDVEIKLKAPLKSEALTDIYETLQNARTIDAVMVYGVYLYGTDGNVLNPYLVVLDDNQSSLDFVNLAGSEARLPDEGAMLTPRMAKALGAEIGGVITVEFLDGTALSIKVADIVDFPVGNEIYISRTAFSKISSLPVETKAFLIKGQSLNLDALQGDPRISLIETKQDMESNMMITLELLESIQIILISFAGLLAFAVMLVLGRMNYNERIRELATLKVLGFHQKEMKRLVLRENIWITIFGLPIGIITGFTLLSMILAQATTSDMEIQPVISAFGIVVGCALIFIFTLFVNYIMGRRFRSIDMVASLKSVE